MRQRTKNFAMIGISCVVSILAFEVTFRFFVVPSPHSYGSLFGRELPPVKVIPERPPQQTDKSRAASGLQSLEKVSVSSKDLWGVMRTDALLGYAPKENTTSPNGWWQSNNLGARARSDFPRAKPLGKKRVLVFGDSFAQGSRVRQEDAWPSILGSKTKALEVLNFGVDGYGMGQSFLRYREIRDQLEYDLVILLFVPSADLWRDINTIRSLAKPWKSYTIMPRFVVEAGVLRLIKSPYETGTGIYKENQNRLSKRVRNHLSKYDRFYVRSRYETPWCIANSVLCKVLAEMYSKFQIQRLEEELWEPASEAMVVSRSIFKAMEDEVVADLNQFVLVVLPVWHDLKLLKSDIRYSNRWKTMVSWLCLDSLVCMDLSEEMLGLPTTQLDRGHDGTHYGPKVNQAIARLVRRDLERLELL